MGIWMRLFATHGMHSQRHVADRAARVIERVIFEMGVDRLVQGTVQLDRHCRPRFSSAAPRGPRRAQASVALGRLAESAALRAALGHPSTDPHLLRRHVAVLVQRLLREFYLQSARFRALPASLDA